MEFASWESDMNQSLQYLHRDHATALQLISYYDTINCVILYNLIWIMNIPNEPRIRSLKFNHFLPQFEIHKANFQQELYQQFLSSSLYTPSSLGLFLCLSHTVFSDSGTRQICMHSSSRWYLHYPFISFDSFIRRTAVHSKRTFDCFPVLHIAFSSRGFLCVYKSEKEMPQHEIIASNAPECVRRVAGCQSEPARSVYKTSTFQISNVIATACG